MRGLILILAAILIGLSGSVAAEGMCVDLAGTFECAVGATTECRFGQGVGVILLNREATCVRN